MSPPVANAPAASATNSSLKSVEDMLVGLKQRLEKEPGDMDGWLLLAKSYHYLNRQAEALEAFDRARSLGYTGEWQPLPRIDSFSNDATPFGSATDSAGGTPAASGKAAVRLRVSMAPGLPANIPPDTPLFIFARDADAPGPPLAVLRKTVHDLPLDVVLDDTSAMMSGRNISSAERIVVGARVSLSGGPVAQPGDYEQLSQPLAPAQAGTVELIISSRVGS